eukprot:CAMPEP_0202980198 /NCGR_PEP_ID=MMETSP1396-20130829/86162_1 /ASSEMBLY_ACC=CAM_ASM_000872 /TAXON_ID= /ORGANISM="Pseudokeronopsis sp., Strain Brazil" /LENGTH=42 /DNA_ID= /DNA_START= /DNA_END= /DNA_ORIENTATION=
MLEYFQKLKQAAAGKDDTVEMQVIIILQMLEKAKENKKAFES